MDAELSPGRKSDVSEVRAGFINLLWTQEGFEVTLP